MNQLDLSKILKEKGLKSTPQRIEILKVISRYGHIDIDSLVNDVKSALPSVSVATIYKNLNMLLEHDIVKEVTLPGRKKMFEISYNKHIHLVCSKCGEINDIEIEENKLKNIFSQLLNKDINDFTVNLYNVCSKCADIKK